MSLDQVPAGPPYLPHTAGVGGRPTVHTDVPILAVFLFFYVIGAASSMTIFQLNRRKGHRFFITWAMFGYCMARITTCIMRIVWATRPSNISIAIAAQIFTSAGVLVLYIVALLLSFRLFCATQPEIAWNKTLDRTLRVMYVLLGSALALVIAFTVLSFFTLNQKLRTAALWIQRGALLYMFVFNVIATLLYLLSLLLPRSAQWENFGSGDMRSKFIILGFVLFFLDFISGFRMGTTWAAPRPISDPAWYDTKPAFYVMVLGFEITVLYILLLTRVDRRFWIPNGSKGPGDFSRSSHSGEGARGASLSSGVQPSTCSETSEQSLEKSPC